jgi:hypothetical protein
VKGTSTGNMADGFGSAFQFAIEDTANVENLIANIQGIRDGADNSGQLVFATYNAGTPTVGMRIYSDQTVSITTGLEPDTDNGAALGSTSFKWSDLFLAEGAVINWDSGDATMTQTGNDITFAGITTFGLGTSTALTTGSIELGHATDTTITRVSPGLIAVEGKELLSNTTTSNVGTTPTSSSTTTISHGLGRVPTIIRIYSGGGFTSNAAATPTTYSIGTYTSVSGNHCIYQGINGTTTIAAASSSTFSIYMITSAGNLISGVIGNVTATDFDIVWTETGTHTRGVYMWECQ